MELPSGLHAPPPQMLPGSGQRVIAGPPWTETFFSSLPAAKPMNWLSGDQNRAFWRAPSVPARLAGLLAVDIPQPEFWLAATVQVDDVLAVGRNRDPTVRSAVEGLGGEGEPAQGLGLRRGGAAQPLHGKQDYGQHQQQPGR